MKSLHLRTWSGIALVAIAAAGGCKSKDGGTGGGATGNSSGASTGADASSGAAHAKPYTGADLLIGEYGSMTGDKADFGKETDNGIQMAFSEINAKGGVLGKKLRVQLEDDGGKPDQAASAVLKLINESNVLAVLGEVASSNSLAAAPICQKAGVPMVSPTSTNPKVTQVGNYIFRTCFIDPFQGTVAAKFARDSLHAKKAAILTDNTSDYSKGLTEFFTNEWKKGGGEIVAEGNSYAADDKDFSAQLTKIKGENPDIIYLPGYYTQVGNIAIQARRIGINQPFLGGDGWDSPKLFEIGKSAVEGYYLTDHYSSDSIDPRVVKFVADYKKLYAGKTPGALAAVAYDAAYVLADAIKRVGGTDRDKLRDAIATTKNYAGVTGIISMDKNRNAAKPLVILQVRNQMFDYVTSVKP